MQKEPARSLGDRTGQGSGPWGVRSEMRSLHFQRVQDP